MNAHILHPLHLRCVGTVLLMLAATATAAVPTLSLKMNASVELTEPIAITVIVSNRTNAPLTLEDPRASTHATLHLVDLATKEDHSFSMGQTSTTDRGQGQWALVAPVVKPVTLAAGKSLDARADANERLFLHPGTFDVFFSLDDVQSNHVTLTVRFGQKTLERLISLAADPNAPYARREWAMELIRRVKKNFTLSLPLPEATAKDREPLEKENAAAVKVLRKWISDQPAAALAKQLATITH